MANLQVRLLNQTKADSGISSRVNLSGTWYYTRGKERVDDRRVISGIVHVLKSGGRWVDAPPDYGTRKTLYNRFVQWTEKGVWTALFETWRALAAQPRKS